MLTLTKFLSGCVGFGAMTLLGTSFFPVPTAGRQVEFHGAASNGGAGLLQAASAQADLMLRRAAVEIPGDLQSFSSTAEFIVASNATTARLQLESMKSTLASTSVRNWLPNGPNWIQNGVEQASEATGPKTKELAAKMPVVNAIKSDLSRLAEVHPVFNLSGSGN